MKRESLILAVLLYAAAAHSSYSQEVISDSERYEQSGRVFRDVQLGIFTGNTSLLGRHFAPHVAMNLRDSESGTFSSNQSYYVLENFFRTRRFDRFEFSTIGGPDATPYASGETEFIQRGNKELVQVYVALSFDGNQYVITQLTIY